MVGKVVVLMGSEKDLDFAKEIGKYLEAFSVPYEFRIASAHKTPGKVLKIIEEYEMENVVYITVARRSNALSAFVDANTVKPVIACPPYSDEFAGADIYSSLRVPSGIGSVVILEPEGAAIAAAKILALADKELEERIKAYQKVKKDEIEKADYFVRKDKTKT
jgi:5-(carboxyamino)imidazole ribonucleotide mutase